MHTRECRWGSLVQHLGSVQKALGLIQREGGMYECMRMNVSGIGPIFNQRQGKRRLWGLYKANPCYYLKGRCSPSYYPPEETAHPCLQYASGASTKASKSSKIPHCVHEVDI